MLYKVSNYLPDLIAACGADSKRGRFIPFEFLSLQLLDLDPLMFMVGGLAAEASDRRAKTVGGRIDRAAFGTLEFCRFFNHLSPFMLVVCGLTAESTC